MFYRKSERLDLSGHVVLETSDGYRIETEHIDMDIANREAATTDAVSAKGPQGSLTADSAQARSEDDGSDAVLRFEGNVRLTFLPAKRD